MVRTNQAGLGQYILIAGTRRQVICSGEGRVWAGREVWKGSKTR